MGCPDQLAKERRLVMQVRTRRLTGVCFPGYPPYRIMIYVVAFFGVLAVVGAGVDVHTAMVTLLAGYVASEITHPARYVACRALPMAG